MVKSDMDLFSRVVANEARHSNRMSMRFHLAVLLLALLLGGCRGDVVREPEDLSIEGTPWRLERVDVSGTVTELGGNEIYSIILEADGFLSGQADCNDCDGSYHFRDDGAIVLSVSCYESACGSSGSTLPHFPIFASGVFDHEIVGSTLTLHKRQNEGTLTLMYIAATD